ncbi:MAG TPA: hypothetical protein VJN95_14305, partial [Gemmatimonadales bacterium]|nr:hypothetical protein [Gemmatimonadales bacterium]
WWVCWHTSSCWAAFVRRFWLGRRLEGAGFVFGAWLAYELSLQVNFTALGSALPFWIFAAAAVVSWGDATREVELRLANPVLAWAVGSAAACLCLATVALGGVLPLLADATLRQAVDTDFAGRPEAAAPYASRARAEAPEESVYATEVGNIAFEQHQWSAARVAYQDAARLGTFNPLVYRNLALADRNLGLALEAKEAARQAVELDRFDPANQALLAEFGG